jgi:hypothetical protein
VYKKIMQLGAARWTIGKRSGLGGEFKGRVKAPELDAMESKLGRSERELLTGRGFAVNEFGYVREIEAGMEACVELD